MPHHRGSLCIFPIRAADGTGLVRHERSFQMYSNILCVIIKYYASTVCDVRAAETNKSLFPIFNQ